MKRIVTRLPSYGALHFTVAVTVAYVISGSWEVALGIGIVEPIVQTFAYALHEWFWSVRKQEPQNAIMSS